MAKTLKRILIPMAIGLVLSTNIALADMGNCYSNMPSFISTSWRNNICEQYYNLKLRIEILWEKISNRGEVAAANAEQEMRNQR